MPGVLSVKDYVENYTIISLSPGACLREAASAKAGERVGVRGKTAYPPPPHSSPIRGCVVTGEMVKNVMLNLFQHLIESNTYETLNQVQGDKKGFTTQPLKGEDNTWKFLCFISDVSVMSIEENWRANKFP